MLQVPQGLEKLLQVGPKWQPKSIKNPAWPPLGLKGFRTSPNNTKNTQRHPKWCPSYRKLLPKDLKNEIKMSSSQLLISGTGAQIL